MLMQTVFEENDKIFAAICAGASGYMLKKTAPQKMIEAIRETSSWWRTHDGFCCYKSVADVQAAIAYDTIMNLLIFLNVKMKF